MCAYISTRKREQISGNDVVGGAGGSQLDGVGFIGEIVLVLLLVAAKGGANAEVTVPFWIKCEVEGRRGI